MTSTLRLGRRAKAGTPLPAGVVPAEDVRERDTMGSMADRKLPSGGMAIGSTVLGNVEPMSDEDSKRFDDDLYRERLGKALEFVLTGARFDTDFRRTLCEEVVALCRDDGKLTAVLKQAANSRRRGRRKKWDLAMYHCLLAHYAYAIHDGCAHDSALAFLVGYVQQMTGSLLSERAIDNQISKGITTLREAGQLDDVLGIADWIRCAIEDRVAKGESSKAR